MSGKTTMSKSSPLAACIVRTRIAFPAGSSEEMNPRAKDTNSSSTSALAMRRRRSWPLSGVPRPCCLAKGLASMSNFPNQCAALRESQLPGSSPARSGGIHPIVLQERRQWGHPNMPGGKGIVRMGDKAQERQDGPGEVAILARENLPSDAAGSPPLRSASITVRMRAFVRTSTPHERPLASGSISAISRADSSSRVSLLVGGHVQGAPFEAADVPKGSCGS